ncbi:ABC transporter permease [Sunxiuqinia elliptica]|uniref:Putative ABC transport system permease protein n=1 Tax=Sunxiuqinia elliptica TaxID=655355 RepID=A0A4R6HAI0_9BACT|nr:ABC transporter permease [Sunxiuqinia elliptica]TDO04691.1 putative ABC transport system permease protein [Sunxiuqinia elliptica]TDO64239.1 putative ABC transport system permease protein [Sunxiuqinia elliptica]
MFDIDKWQEILSTIKKNKMRTFLTGFSVAWGIFMLMILLGSGNGLSNGVASNFMNDAVNAMWIWTGETTIAHQGLKPGRPIQFHNDDYDIITNIPGVETASGRYFMGNTRYSYGKESGEYTTVTCHPELNEVDRMELLEGRFINDVDILQNRKVVVIGKDIHEALFKEKPALGEYVRINNVPFKVVGVCIEPESTRNRNAYMPVSTAQKVFNGSNRLHNFAITINGETLDESQAIEERIRTTFARKHRFDVADESAMGMYNKLENYIQTMRIFQAIKIFIWIIGIGTLIAGIVGVSNIMLIVVKERTKEIGIRKAIGASPASVIGLILLESILITTLAGYIGLVLGTGLMELINYAMVQSAGDAAGQGETIFLNPTVDFGVAVSATILLVVAGTIAGYIPAKRAASIKPIVALRDE